MLCLDNFVNITEKDEFGYHEMMVHPCLVAHKNPQSVLIIGGGDGGVIREVLRHECVKKLVEVEIDGEVIQASREYFPQVALGYDSKKLELIVGDGIDFMLKAPSESFDIILVDSTDPGGPSEELFSEEFYENCKRVLTKDGILVT